MLCVHDTFRSFTSSCGCANAHLCCRQHSYKSIASPGCCASLAMAQESEPSSCDLKNTTSSHTAACAAVSFFHVDLATNELVCWQALGDGWPCRLDPALWAIQVAICCVFHNPLLKGLDQIALAPSVDLSSRRAFALAPSCEAVKTGEALHPSFCSWMDLEATPTFLYLYRNVRHFEQ